MDEGTDSYNLKVEAMAEVKEKNLTFDLNLNPHKFMVKLLRAYGGCLGVRRR